MADKGQMTVGQGIGEVLHAVAEIILSLAYVIRTPGDFIRAMVGLPPGDRPDLSDKTGTWEPVKNGR